MALKMPLSKKKEIPERGKPSMNRVLIYFMRLPVLEAEAGNGGWVHFWIYNVSDLSLSFLYCSFTIMLRGRTGMRSILP